VSPSLIDPLALTSDGQGGVWFEGHDWLQFHDQPDGPDPGTHSLWGTGILTPMPNGTTEGVIYQYGR
jgi:hypothetical protein